MSFLNELRKRAISVLAPKNNSIDVGQANARQFLKYGNKRLLPDWTAFTLDDASFYTQYGYAAINNRANVVARVAEAEVWTDAKDELMKKDRAVVHPYLELINNSTDFSAYQFWSDISTYMDITGIYYLMAIRGIGEGKVGRVQSLKLLNPYNIRRVVRKDTLELGGYVENRNGMQREIPKEMIIEFRELNPFDQQSQFSKKDASQGAQYNLQTADDYTRHALKNNINSPGIITTDVIIPDEDFDNFRRRINGTDRKGEPIYGNGPGSIKWDPMQIDLDKSALANINEINRDSLFAVTGVSKTIMGIEQSGTTRETAKVQKDLYLENHILPRIQKIIDALNLDYKRNYPKDFESNNFVIKVVNPTKSDVEIDQKQAEVRAKELDLYNTLIEKGYNEEIAGKYAIGDIDATELGKTPKKDKTADEQSIKEICNHKGIDNIIHNALNDKDKATLDTQQAQLHNAIVNIDSRIVSNAIKRIQKKVNNQANNNVNPEEFTLENTVSKKEENDAKEELALLLLAFFGVVINIYGSTIMRRRISEFGRLGTFRIDSNIRKYIKQISQKTAESHINTIIKDIYSAIQSKAIEGATTEELIDTITKQFSGKISEARAKTIAVTETNRAFTRSQYEADIQFVTENGLEKKAFKKWRTRSDNPCPVCQALAKEPPIPLAVNFRDLGETMTATEMVGDTLKTTTMTFDYEVLEAGNAHPNCQCNYVLIIED